MTLQTPKSLFWVGKPIYSWGPLVLKHAPHHKIIHFLQTRDPIICGAFFGWRQRVDAPAVETLQMWNVGQPFYCLFHLCLFLALYHHLHHGNASQLVPKKRSKTSQQSVAANPLIHYHSTNGSHLLAAKMSFKNVRPQRQQQNYKIQNPKNQKSQEHNESEKITQFGDDTWTSEKKKKNNKSLFWMIQNTSATEVQTRFPKP